MINCKNKNTEIKLEEKVVIPCLELKEEEPESNTSNNSNSNLNKKQNEMNHINYKEKIEKEEKDPMRRNAKLLMFNSLIKSTNESLDTNNIFTIISNIEEDLINTFSKEKVKYLKQVKQIVMGIQNNKEFVENILTGTITPYKISQMSTNDFASEAIKEHRKKLQEDAFNSRRSDWNYLRNPGVAGIYRCRKCKCNRTTYYQAQIRRADEPMTTFITCLECTFQWKQ